MTIQHAKSGRWKKPARGASVPGHRLRSDEILGEEVRQATQRHPGRRMTEEEFLNWVGEKTRAEWVEGEVIVMSPVNLDHDEIQGWLYRLFCEFVEANHLGQVHGSEYAIRLGPPPRRRLTDVFFVARGREEAFAKTAFHGPPDLVVEVVSPDSAARDYREKFLDYQAAGVREYWIVNPLSQTVDVQELVKGKYRRIEEKNGILRSKVLKGLFIKPAWLWYRPFPRLAQALREMGVS